MVGMKNYKTLLTKSVIGALMSVAIMPLTVMAATQGSEGTTSSGTSDLSVVVPKLVKIIGISDLSQSYDGGAGGFNQNDDVCIYSNMDTGTGRYTVRINGDNNPKATSPTAGFYVGNATTDQEIAYTVRWNDEAGTTSNAAVTHNTDLTTQSGFTNTAACSSGNANFQVQMSQADLLTLRPATYTGRITILITPE
jgi:hypothetical protein